MRMVATAVALRKLLRILTLNHDAWSLEHG
jgi:hypothetical protein